MPRLQNPLFTLFNMFDMKGHQMQVFKFLMEKPMTIKQLQKATRMSERILRTHLDDLSERKLVGKRVIEDNRLKYLYYTNPPETIVSIVKVTINRIEKRRLEMKKNIIRGTKTSTKWK